VKLKYKAKSCADK